MKWSTNAFPTHIDSIATNDIDMQSYSPSESNLTETIRTALSSTAFVLDKTDSPKTSDHLHLFASQIDAKAKEIALNASRLLSDFELHYASPTNLISLDDVAIPHLTETDVLNFNLTYVSTLEFRKHSLHPTASHLTV